MKLSLPVCVLLIAASASAQQTPVQGPLPVTERSGSAAPSQFSSVHIDAFSLDANSFIEALLKVSAQFQLPLGGMGEDGGHAEARPDLSHPYHFGRGDSGGRLHRSRV
ncbi:MAG: hypothetical protein ABSE42_23575 [Bryobacteraceae bacterium]